MVNDGFHLCHVGIDWFVVDGAQQHTPAAYDSVSSNIETKGDMWQWYFTVLNEITKPLVIWAELLTQGNSELQRQSSGLRWWNLHIDVLHRTANWPATASCHAGHPHHQLSGQLQNSVYRNLAKDTHWQVRCKMWLLNSWWENFKWRGWRRL